MRLTRGPWRIIKPPSDRPQTVEEERTWSTFRAFKAGITGEKGEGLVMAALAKLGVPALHNVILPDSRGLTQIDHIVRASDAIVVLETKHYGGAVGGEVHSREWTQCFEGNPDRFMLPNPLRQNYRHRLAVSQSWLDAAWQRLQAAAEASPALREAHRQEVSMRRP